MATITEAAPAVKPARRPRTAKPKPADTCRLTLTIRGEDYRARVLPADTAAGVLALVRVRKLSGGEPYHVARHAAGHVSCECADYHFRHEGNGSACKHGRACIAVGLISAPAAPDRSADQGDIDDADVPESDPWTVGDDRDADGYF
jgi:hypothetical protein